jgi:hypothetical protein
MMPSSLSQSLDLPEDIRSLLARFVEQINQEWADNFGSLVLFGSAARGDFIIGRSNINVLLIVQSITVEVLRRAGRLHQEWGKQQIVAPLLMTEKDLVTSRDLFPLEFLQMTQSHVVLAGRDPFGEAQIDLARLGFQCEQELMANLLRVRQRFIEGEGRNEAIQALLILSITAVLPCLRGILYCLAQHSPKKDMQILESLPDIIQFDATIFLDVLGIKRGLSSPGSLEWPKAFGRYLDHLERFLGRIHEIRQEGRL